MAKCRKCQQETQREATVYIGRPSADPESGLTSYQLEPLTACICETCAQEYAAEGGKSGILFYLALQMCWLTVFKSGLLTPMGIFGAVVGSAALIRLAVNLLKLLLHKLRPHAPLPGWLSRKAEYSQDASDVLKSLIYREQDGLGNTVLSLREYNRRFQS